MLNTFFLADEIFTGKFKQYKIVDDKYESKCSHKELDTVTQQPKEQPDTTDMPDLESEESAAQRSNQQGERLTILTPNQMLTRLAISLAQLKARNNSKKLKNETR